MNLTGWVGAGADSSGYSRFKVPYWAWDGAAEELGKKDVRAFKLCAFLQDLCCEVLGIQGGVTATRYRSGLFMAWRAQPTVKRGGAVSYHGGEGEERLPSPVLPLAAHRFSRPVHPTGLSPLAAAAFACAAFLPSSPASAQDSPTPMRHEMLRHPVFGKRGSNTGKEGSPGRLRSEV